MNNFIRIPSLATPQQFETFMDQADAERRKREARHGGVHAAEIAQLEQQDAAAFARAKAIADGAETDPAGPRTLTAAETAAFHSAVAESEAARDKIRALEHAGAGRG